LRLLGAADGMLKEIVVGGADYLKDLEFLFSEANALDMNWPLAPCYGLHTHR
jgi:hypothetical protein